MTPEATWLSLAIALAVIWTAGWVGWHLAWLKIEKQQHIVLRHNRKLSVSPETLERLTREVDL